MYVICTCYHAKFVNVITFEEVEKLEANWGSVLILQVPWIMLIKCVSLIVILQTHPNYFSIAFTAQFVFERKKYIIFYGRCLNYDYNKLLTFLMQLLLHSITFSYINSKFPCKSPFLQKQWPDKERPNYLFCIKCHTCTLYNKNK